MIEGHFIVLEGIDGSGTTTQTAEIKKRFDSLGLPSHVTAEPSTGPVGSIIRQILTGRLVVRQHHGVSTPSWTTMSLLFAADRQDHVESEIWPNMRDGVNVICDRYVYSSIAYQSVSSKSEQSINWIHEINRFIKKPDLVLYLRIDPEEAQSRCRMRGQGIEIFDDPEFQHKLAKAYDKLARDLDDVNLATIDGDRPIEDVAEECWSHVERLRSSGASR
jgi:dTMP kinase